MRSILFIFGCFALLVSPGNSAIAQQTTPAAKTPSPSIVPGQPVLEDGTPVKLRIAQTISSADAHVNDRVEFEVLEEVRVSDVLIVPKGGLAWGTVTEAEPKRRMARGGKLEIVMDSVRLADGERAALRATKEAKGGGHTGAMTAGIVATGLIFWPAAPFFLFMHGKDITIPKGTEVPTFVDGNLPLELAKFRAPGSAPVPQPSVAVTEAVSASPASVAISSTPPGAEITIDQNFVGNAPSTVTLSPGKHHVLVQKQGFDSWERDVNVSGGSINISAELIKTVSAPKAASESPKKPEVESAPKANTSRNTAPAEKSSSELRVTGASQPEEANHGWIGIKVKDDSGEIVIDSVERLSPADKAELQVGDKILQLNGATVKSAREFEAAVAQATPGSQIQIGYRRTYWMFTATVSVLSK